jgi:hypothetical protein
MKSLKYDFFNSNNARNFQVYNNTGTQIQALKVVRVTGYNSTYNAVQIALMSAFSQKALGVTNTAIPNSQRGDVVITGIIDNINTSAVDIMDPVFFDTSGNLVFSGPSNAKIGYVLTKAANGRVFVNLSGSGGDSASLAHNVLVAPDASLKKGMPVYWTGSEYLPAIADDIETVAVGVVSELGSGDYTVALGGMLTLTINEWNQITGSTGGLVPGITYYLDDGVAGRIGPLAPAISNAVLLAVSSTEAILQLKVSALPDGTGDSIVQEIFTSSASQTDFTLLQEPLGKAYIWLALDGTLENSYTIINGKTIRLDNPISAGVEVDVRYIRYFNIETNNQIYVFDETVSGSPKTTFTMPVTPNNIHNIFVFVDGSLQMDSYSFIGSTLTFDTAVPVGRRVYAKIMQGLDFDADINSYYKRKSISLINDSDTLVSTVFEENLSGKYSIRIETDPRIFCDAWLSAGNGASFFTLSASVSNFIDTANSLNVIYSDSTIKIQNKLGSTKNIIITRET